MSCCTSGQSLSPFLPHDSASNLELSFTFWLQKRNGPSFKFGLEGQWKRQKKMKRGCFEVEIRRHGGTDSIIYTSSCFSVRKQTNSLFLETSSRGWDKWKKPQKSCRPQVTLQEVEWGGKQHTSGCVVAVNHYTELGSVSFYKTLVLNKHFIMFPANLAPSADIITVADECQTTLL